MKTKRLVTDAMLIAMYFVFGMLSIDLWGWKLTFEGFPVLVGAALFGPLDGLIIGLLGSFLDQVTGKYGLTATTILWILPSGVRGLTVGWYALRKNLAMTRVQTIAIVILSSLIVTTLNSLVWYVDSLIYHYPYIMFAWSTVARYLTGIVLAVVFSLVLPPLLRIIRDDVLARKAPRK